MDKIAAMRAFVRVVQAGTFTKAADSLGIEKSQVSRQVQLLESELRTRLLTRTTRRMRLTAEGEQYYEGALRLLREMDELESTLSSASGTPRGKVRVVVSASVAQRVILPHLPRFLERYPEIRVDLGVSDAPNDLIGNNVDCAIRGGEIDDLSLVARRIGELPTMMCATPQYLERHGIPEHPLDLERQGHRVVNYFSRLTGQSYPFRFERGDERITLQPAHLVAVNDGNANVAAGLAGLGIIRTTRLMGQPYVDSGQLRQVLGDWISDRIPAFLVYPPNRHLTVRVRTFADWVIELFASLDLAPEARAASGRTRATAAASRG